MMTVIVNGQERQVPKGSTYHEVAMALSREDGKEYLLAQTMQGLRELHHKVRDRENFRLLTIVDNAGYKAYQRSMCLMMLRSFRKIEQETGAKLEVKIHFVVSDGLYCTLQDPALVSEDLLEDVKDHMKALQMSGIRIHKRNVSTTEAQQMFHNRGMFDKEKLFRYRLSSRTNVYELDGFLDYYYGYMVYDTSVLDTFDLKKYQDGFVLCLPEMGGEERLPEYAPVEKLFQIQNKSLEWGKMMGIRTVGDLNDLIVQGRTKELILTQEAYHEKQVAEIAQKIAMDPQKKIVMIAGPSSSSKTTFSHRLSTQLSVYGVTPHPIPVDDYFVNRDQTPKDADGNFDFECLEAIDIQQFNEDMGRLLKGERVELPTYNFVSGKREYKGKFLQLGEHDILVIEGIHCLNDQLSYALPKESKFKIYISALTQLNVDEHNRIATTDGRLLRRMVRDARTRGNSATDTIRMWPSVRRGEENHIFPYQESADVMFNSALIYELAVLKIYAEPLLFSVDPESPEYVEAKRLLKFLDYFVPFPADEIPRNSLIREFIGGSCFDV